MEEETEESVMPVIVEQGGFLPHRAYALDAGLDLRSPEDGVIPAHGYIAVDTLVHVQLPHGTYGKLCSKSGLNILHGITSDGTIDEGYVGSIKVALHNDGDEDYEFKRGDKITQLVIHKIDRPLVVQTNQLHAGDRGNNGYGSTGR